MLAYIKLAHDEGGTLLAGGHRATVPGRCENGYFLEPTVFENLPHDCRVNQEEIFGPVVTLTPFDTDEEALMMANSTDYGLSATIWTCDLRRAHRLAHQLHAGIVWVNTWLHRDLRTPIRRHEKLRRRPRRRAGGAAVFHRGAERVREAVGIVGF